MEKNQVSFRVLIPKGVDTVLHLMQTVAAFKPYVTARAEKHMDKFMAERIADGGYDESTAYDYWVDRRIAMYTQGFADPEVDTGFTLHFAPLVASYATDQPAVLGIAYAGQEAWLREWLKQPTVEEYGYWGVKHRPSRIRAEDWDERGREWDATMIPHEAMSTQSLSIEVLGPYEPYPKGMRATDEPTPAATTA